MKPDVTTPGYDDFWSCFYEDKNVLVTYSGTGWKTVERCLEAKAYIYTGVLTEKWHENGWTNLSFKFRLGHKAKDFSVQSRFVYNHIVGINKVRLAVLVASFDGLPDEDKNGLTYFRWMTEWKRLNKEGVLSALQNRETNKTPCHGASLLD